MRASAAGLLLASHAAARRSPLDKPNFLLLYVDDLGYGDVAFNGHPTTETPAIDALARGGKVLSTWYSACPVCSASRASLLTGRQWPRMGIPGVFMPTTSSGMPLNETSLADQLKRGGYATAAVGKWHLGQRRAYLPAARGFDRYLGIPYSDDMGAARRSACGRDGAGASAAPWRLPQTSSALADGLQQYVDAGLSPAPSAAERADPGGDFLPLVSQRRLRGTGAEEVQTEVVEQPLDFTNLSSRYTEFALSFVDEHTARPFLLYMPFSHVHATAPNQPGKQYSDCRHQNTTRRGGFGDALSEVDSIIGAVVGRLSHHGLEGNTLVLFAGDNGPDLFQGAAAGSTGIFGGRHAGYWNVGKGSTWEGGIREAAFAYWPGVISPATRTAEIVSALDVFPTLLNLAGLPLPADRQIDGKDMSRLLMHDDAVSEHEVLFFYGGAAGVSLPSAARYGPYKAHWATGPGLGGCGVGPAAPVGCAVVEYAGGPLVFHVEHDPSEAYALTQNTTAPPDPILAAVVARLVAEYAKQVASLQVRPSPPAPDGPGEGPGRFGVCCNRTLGCDCDGAPYGPKN